MGFFRWLGRCCCPECRPCPYPFQNKRGWTTTPIPGCTQCPNCPPCPFPYAAQTGWSTTFSNECPKCPRCEDDPCYITGTPSTLCTCIPTRFLCVIAGVNATCACFCADDGCATDPGEIFPHNHFESSGSVNTSFCVDGVTAPPTPAVGSKLWGNDPPAPSLCAVPYTLVVEGFVANITAGVSGFGSIVEASCSISAENTGALIFCGRLRNSSCAGPWVVSNTAPGCVREMFFDAGTNCGNQFVPTLSSGSGGTATFYACGC